MQAGFRADQVQVAGRYVDYARTSDEQVPEHPEHPTLLYNLACCESLAGRPGDAVEHLRAAIELHEEFRQMAADDSDFDPIRDQPAFGDLVGEP
jgi:hypothetical protein